MIAGRRLLWHVSSGSLSKNSDRNRAHPAEHGDRAAALLDRIGRHEPAATIVGFALSPLTASAFSEISTAAEHLRRVLGNDVFEALARGGEALAATPMVRLALEEIELARDPGDAESQSLVDPSIG